MPGRSLPSPKRYARALMELAQARGDVEGWEGILTEMAAAAAREEFVVLLQAPGVKLEEKLEALCQVLPEATELGYNFLALLIQRRAVTLLPRIQQEFQALADTARGVQQVEVRSAVDLDQGEQRRIQEQLAAWLGKDVRLTARVEPELLGGLVMRIGDRLLDGSARGRLEALRRSLLAGAG